MSTPVARAPHPTDTQLAHMAHLINDYDGRPIGAIMRDVWDYVAGQIEAQRKADVRKAAAEKAQRTRAENERIQRWKQDNI